MPNPPALFYDTYYHIYNRGINHENIFVEERNYSYFLQIYEKYIEPVVETFAYCLMRNHFHLLVRIKSQDEISFNSLAPQLSNSQTPKVSETFGVLSPSHQFSRFFNAYAKSINKALGRTGSLFQRPFGRVLISSNAQLWTVLVYIHQNPQKHRFVEDFRNWNWSSYKTLGMDQPTRLKRDTVLDWFGGRQAYLDLHAHKFSEAQRQWLERDDD